MAVIVCSTLLKHPVFSDFRVRSLPVPRFFLLQIHLAFVSPGFAESHTKSSFAATDHCSDVVPLEPLVLWVRPTSSHELLPQRPYSHGHRPGSFVLSAVFTCCHGHSFNIVTCHSCRSGLHAIHHPRKVFRLSLSLGHCGGFCRGFLGRASL